MKLLILPEEPIFVYILNENLYNSFLHIDRAINNENGGCSCVADLLTPSFPLEGISCGIAWRQQARILMCFPCFDVYGLFSAPCL